MSSLSEEDKRIREEKFAEADSKYHGLVEDPKNRERHRQPNGTIEYYHKQAHYFHGDEYEGKKGLEKTNILRAIGFINIALNIYKSRLGIPREQT